MDLSLIVPFYNEEKNVVPVIKHIVKELNTLKIKYEIIAVDNGSTDRTGQRIDSFTKHVRKVIIDKNQGYGYGVICGLAAGKGNILGWIDGDGQISASMLPRLFKLAGSKGPGIYKVKRTIREDGPQRNFFSHAYNNLLRLIFGIKTVDVNACPKLFQREIYEKLDLESKDWFIDSEVMIKSNDLGYRTYSIGARFKRRKEGASNVSSKTIFEFCFNLARFYVKRLFF